jgi:hypothetical protein
MIFPSQPSVGPFGLLLTMTYSDTIGQLKCGHSAPEKPSLVPLRVQHLCSHHLIAVTIKINAFLFSEPFLKEASAPPSRREIKNASRSDLQPSVANSSATYRVKDERLCVCVSGSCDRGSPGSEPLIHAKESKNVTVRRTVTPSAPLTAALPPRTQTATRALVASRRYHEKFSGDRDTRRAVP